MKTSHFRFDATLTDLFPRSKRAAELEYRFSGPQSAKHLIEALGIPHTEIGSILGAGQPLGLNYPVRDGDRIEVRSNSPDPDARDEPRFVLDGHLGRLNSGLRMIGLDCLYHGDYEDEELAEISVSEKRTLLTRDRRLLMRKSVSQGYLVRNLDARQQLAELTQRFQLAKWFRPFIRCIRCNGLLEQVEKQAVVDRLQPLTRLHYEEFHVCPSCGQIYWNGSHVDKMMKVISSLRPEQAV